MTSVELYATTVTGMVHTARVGIAARTGGAFDAELARLGLLQTMAEAVCMDLGSNARMRVDAADFQLLVEWTLP